MRQKHGPSLYSVIGGTAETEREAARLVTEHLQRSSLYRIVAGMEESRHRLMQAKPSPIILPTRVQNERTDPYDLLRTNSFLAFGLIREDTELKTFEAELLETARDSYDADVKTARVADGVDRYAAFLASNAHFQGKMIALTPDFQNYLRDLAEHSGPGPYFNKTLRALTHGNNDLIGFILLNSPTLVMMDHFYLRSEKASDVSGETIGMLKPGETVEQHRYPGLQSHIELNLERVADDIETFYNFRRTADQVIDIIFNPDDTSPWKQFLSKAFPDIAHTILLNWDRKNYNPAAGLARARRFFEAAGVENAVLIGQYLMESLSIRNKTALAKLDDELISGNLEKISDFIRFRTTVKSHPDGNAYYQGESEALGYWTEQVASGTIDKASAELVARSWASRKTTLASLPDPVKFSVCQFKGPLPGVTEDEFSVPGSLMDLATFQNSEKSNRLIAVGLPPAPALITEIDNNPLALARIAEFSGSLFETARQNRFEPIGDIIINWSLKLLRGEADPTRLEAVSRAVIKLINAKNTLLTKLPFQSDRIRRDFKSLLTSENPESSADAVAVLAENGLYPAQESIDKLVQSGESGAGAISALTSNGIYPTLHLIDYAAKEGDRGIENLLQLREQAARGNFDPTNRLARELCYREFLEKSRADGDHAYSRFSGISIITPDDLSSELHPKERHEAQIGSFENAYFLLHLEKWVEQSDRDIVMVGNERNGAIFVVDPLKSELDRLGIRTRFLRIPSSGTGSLSVFDVFPDGFTRELAEKAPHVIIVDRSDTSIDHRGKARMPSAMSGYLNWFTAFNRTFDTDNSGFNPPVQDQEDFRDEAVRRFLEEHQNLTSKLSKFRPRSPYLLRHWVPQPTDLISIGNNDYQYRTFDSGETRPQAVLANPVITPGHFDQLPSYFSDHDPRFLDDPNDHASGREKFAFTSDGLVELFGDKTEAEFVRLVQDRMIDELPAMLRLAQNIYFERMGL